MLATEANVADWITAVASAVSATAIIGAFAAAIFAWQQLRQARQTHEAQMAADISRRWDEPEMSEARHLARTIKPEDFAARFAALRAENSVDFYVIQREPNFLEDLGILEATGGISFEWIVSSMGEILPASWARYEPLQDSPFKWEHFRALAVRCDQALQELEAQRARETPGQEQKRARKQARTTKKELRRLRRIDRSSHHG